MNPLVAGVEATGVTGHGNQPGFFLHFNQFAGIVDVVGHWNFDHDVLAGLQAGNGLAGVQLSRCGENDRIEFRLGEGLFQRGERMGNAVVFGEGRHLFGVPANNRVNLDAINVANGVEVLHAKGASRACDTNFHD